MVAPLAVDPMALDGAGSSVRSVGEQLGPTISTLTSALAGCGGTCGDDPAGEALASSYDASATALIDAMTQVRNGLARIGDGVRMSAANYSAAEAGSNVAGGAQPLPPPPLTDLISAASVPSGAGGGTPAPPGWGWVAPFIGMIWPTADSGRLRAAAAAWTAAGTQFVAIETGAAGPLGVVGAQHIPEADAIGVAFAAATRGGGEVLGQCATIASTLSTYAAHVDAVHAAVLHLLAQICDPLAGIKIVWDFLTGDDDEIERIANEIKTVTDNFKSEVSALAGQIAGLAAEATVTATNMAIYARKEWNHFLHDTAVGKVVDGILRFDKDFLAGFLEEAGGLVKTTLWTYNPQRAFVDPVGLCHDYETLARGSAPLVGLGGDGAPGVARAWQDLGKNAVHWDDWSKDPAEAAGRSVFDVASLFIPGGGEAGIAGRSARVAADAAEAAARAERPLEGLAAVPRVPEVPRPPVEPLPAPRPPVEPPTPRPPVEGPPVAHDTPAPTPGQSAPDAKLPVAEAPNAARPLPEAVQGPAGAASPQAGDLVANAVRGAAPSAMGDAAQIPPLAHVQPDIPPVADGHGFGGHDGRSVLTSSDSSGPHWHRIDDGPANPDYGQPVQHHGDSGPYPEHTPENQATWDLVEHPEEPYGHDANGHLLTKEQYDARYREVQPGGEVWDVYPPNGGAVPGSRVVYESAQAFIRDFGNSVDRIGGIDGKYFGVMENGLPASFEERSLPIQSLNQPLFQFHWTGELPQGWTIEVSEVGPGFGRDGGGLQMIVVNAEGRTVPVWQLQEEGVVE